MVRFLAMKLKLFSSVGFSLWPESVGPGTELMFCFYSRNNAHPVIIRDYGMTEFFSVKIYDEGT